MRVMLTASVPVDLAEDLRARARQADRSLSAELRCAIRAHLSRAEEGASDVASSARRPAGEEGRDARE